MEIQTFVLVLYIAFPPYLDPRGSWRDVHVKSSLGFLCLPSAKVNLVYELLEYFYSYNHSHPEFLFNLISLKDNTHHVLLQHTPCVSRRHHRLRYPPPSQALRRSSADGRPFCHLRLCFCDVHRRFSMRRSRRGHRQHHPGRSNRAR